MPSCDFWVGKYTEIIQDLRTRWHDEILLSEGIHVPVWLAYFHFFPLALFHFDCQQLLQTSRQLHNRLSGRESGSLLAHATVSFTGQDPDIIPADISMFISILPPVAQNRSRCTPAGVRTAAITDCRTAGSAASGPSRLTPAATWSAAPAEQTSVWAPALQGAATPRCCRRHHPARPRRPSLGRSRTLAAEWRWGPHPAQILRCVVPPGLRGAACARVGPGGG